MTVFPWMSRPDLMQHLKSRTDATCRRCQCPCGGTRMTSPAPGCTPEPQAPCNFFQDVFPQFSLDSEWYAVAAAAHRQRQGNFFSNPEGRRILEEFEAAGCSPDEVRYLFRHESSSLQRCSVERACTGVGVALTILPVPPSCSCPYMQAHPVEVPLSRVGVPYCLVCICGAGVAMGAGQWWRGDAEFRPTWHSSGCFPLRGCA